MIRQAIETFGSSVGKAFPDRTRTVGASEIGLCARKIHWGKKAGMKDEGFISNWGAHVRGTMMEQTFWLPAMRAKFGEKLIMAGDDQQSLEDGYLSATPDGLVVDQPLDVLQDLGVPDIEGSCVVVECKTVDPRVNLVKERDNNHFQVQVQMGVIRKKTLHQPMHAVISYTDASFWDEVEEFPVRFDQGIYDSAQARAKMILTAADPRELKPEGWIAGGGECEHCPFTGACGIIRRSLPQREVAADPQFVAEIADMCRDVQDAKEQIDILDREVREGQQKIKDRLREKSVRKIPGVVSWSAVKGRESYDMKGIKAAATAAGLNLDPFCTAGEPTDRLQISVGRPRSE